MKTPPEVCARLFQERTQRLKRLIELNAPDVIIYMTAKTLLVTETQNRKWLAIWKWVKDEVRSTIGGWRADLHIWWLMRRGWSKDCALNIHFDHDQERHKKTGCDCEDAFEKALAGVLRREQ